MHHIGNCFGYSMTRETYTHGVSEHERLMITDATNSLPVLPTPAVLFPGMPMPLNIQEPSHQLLIHDVIDSTHELGVILDRSPRTNHSHQMARMGTVARITGLQNNDDGSIDLWVRGFRRFQMLELTTTSPYPKASVLYLPDADTQIEREDIELVRRAAVRLVRYLELMNIAEPQAALQQLPHNAQALANMLATLVQARLADKQRLLECNSITERLCLGVSLLDHELSRLSCGRPVSSSPLIPMPPFITGSDLTGIN